MLFNRQPALILGFIGAAIALAIGFGLKLSGEQVNNIMIFAAATIALATGVAIRSQVVPVEKAREQIAVALLEPPTTTVAQVIAKEERQNNK